MFRFSRKSKHTAVLEDVRAALTRKISLLEGDKLNVMMEMTRLKAATTSLTAENSGGLVNESLRATQDLFMQFKEAEMKNIECQIEWIRDLLSKM